MVRSELEAKSEISICLNEKKPIRVLHVDDNIVFLKATKEFLELKEFFEVDTSTSYADAIEKIGKKKYDVIVSNYQIQEKDGLQLLYELRKNGNNTPFIIFAEKGKEEILIKALNLGADHYINKGGTQEVVFTELAHSICRLAESKRTENRIKGSEEKYRKIFENAKDGIVFLDKKGKIIDVNIKATEIFGGKKEELIGKHFKEIGALHPDDIQRAMKAFADGIAGKSFSINLHIRNKNQKEFVIECSAFRAIVNDELVTVAIIRDVTDRVQAEEACRASEEKYRTLVENSLQGIVVVQDFRIVFANRAFAEISGYTVEELLSLPPESVKALVHPDDRKLVWGRFLDRLQGKSVEPRYEYRGIRKDGKICWLEMFANRVYYNGKPAIQGAIIDITERKKAEQEAEENKVNIVKLISYIPEAAAYLDENFRIVAINTRFSEFFGYSEEEVKDKHIDDVVVPKDLLEQAKKLNNDAKEGYASFYAVRKRKDGTLVPVSISAAPAILRNKFLGYVVFYKDITELKKLQDELEESRKHFQSLFNLMADPVAIVDEKGKILEVTQKVEEITGFKKEELIGKNFLKTEIATAKTKAMMIKNLVKRMLGVHIDPYEVEILTKDKRKLMYEINAVKIDYKGKSADLVVFRDISDRKKLEEKLRVVGGLTRHDVRNKLSVVTGNVYLLKQKLNENAEALKRLESIDMAVRQIEQIFEFARNYEKLGVEKLTCVDVGKAFDEAASLFSAKKGIEIINEFRGLTVLADSLLRQLFYNLIDNSLKYGQKVKTIRIRYKRISNDKLEIIYEDDGVGIPSEIRKKLFREGVGKGTGYGLFMIKRICEVYGWVIEESGQPNKGVKFTMKINIENSENVPVTSVIDKQKTQFISDHPEEVCQSPK